ncbi:E3 ubiquitin-protein ligase UBR1-like protein [Gracilaria domingensis]|nr:E3 ubiquitin-protein ligase UBR1-like protein [Gracilaria domingensis]
MLITDETISARPFWEQFEGLRRLSLSLCEQHGLSLATVTLRETFGLSHLRRIQTTTCAAALHMLCSNVESVSTTYPPGEAEVWLSKSCRPESFTRSPIGILCNLVRRVTELQPSLFSDFMPVFSRIIRESCKRCSFEDRSFLHGQIPEAMRSLCIENSARPREGDVLDVGEERRRNLLAKKKERQAAAMARMRVAQANFAKLISGTDGSRSEPVLEQGVCDTKMRQEDGNHLRSVAGVAASRHADTHEAERGHPKVVHKCALCHEAEVSDESGPLGYIGFRQNTKLPRISKYQCKLNSQSDSGHSNSAPSGREVHTKETEMETTVDTAVSTDFVSTQQKLVHLDMLSGGVESSKCLHISLCSHVIHMGCFERYFSSLLHSNSRRILFEGFNVVNLQRVEFLCPVCRRLANLVLPCVRFPRDGGRCSDAAVGNSKLTRGDESGFLKWLEKSRLNIFDNTVSPYQVNLYGSMGRLEWNFHDGVFQASLPFNSEANDIGDPQAAGVVLRMLERFRVSMETYSSFTTDAYGQKCRIWTCSYGLPVALTSTIASAEILARSFEWDSSALQTTRRTLPKIFACARSQFYMSTKHQGEECRKAIQGLWNIVTTEKLVLADPFVTLSYLFLMWPNPLRAEDVGFLIRLSFDCLVRQIHMANSTTTLTNDLVIFLRRVSILHWCVLPWEKPPLSPFDERTSSLASTSREVEDIAQYLNVPRIGSFWTEEMSLALRDKKIFSSGDELVLSRLVMPKPASLLRLPSLFQTLLESLNGSSCSKCWRLPKNPALCLVCGKVLCGPHRANVMEIAMHADACGAGIGVFLLLKEAKIYILRGDRGVEWGSPYLDSHGEEDESLRRGTPLLLNNDRYSVLEQMWLCHGFDQDPRILVKTQRTSSPRDLSPAMGPLGPVAPVRPVR